ncbi:hypothetical protein EU514_14525 [Pseudomonas fragi]|nr:hypothetical protein [Pseudomonas fragi]
MAGVLWERACSRWYRLGLPDKPRSLNREQARSHKECVFCLLPDKRLALCIAHFQAHGHAPA